MKQGPDQIQLNALPLGLRARVFRLPAVRRALFALGLAAIALFGFAVIDRFRLVVPHPSSDNAVPYVVILALGLGVIVLAAFVFATSRDRPLHAQRWKLACFGSLMLAIAILEGLHLTYGHGLADFAFGRSYTIGGYFRLAALTAGVLGFAALAWCRNDVLVNVRSRLRLDGYLAVLVAVLVWPGIGGTVVAEGLGQAKGALSATGRLLALVLAVIAFAAAWQLLVEAAQSPAVDLETAAYDRGTIGAAAGLWGLACLVPVVLPDALMVRVGAVTSMLLTAVSAYFVFRGVARWQVEETSARLALVTRSARIGAFSIDVPSGAVSLDDAMRDMLGGGADVGAVAALAGHLVDEDGARFLQCYRAAIVGSDKVPLSLVVQTAATQGKASRWLELTALIMLEDGTPVRLVGVAQDITRFRQAELALEESLAQYAGTISIAADAIISIDAGQRITDFNRGAETIFGFKASEVIGKPLTILMPERFHSRHASHVASFARSEVTARQMGERSEIVALRKGGTEFFAEASISRIEVNGRPRFTVVLRDITERKQLQNMLERRVAESTRELREEMRRREASQAQLVRTQRMEAFGQLTGGIAHDFNNLLTVITGNLELLDMRLQGEKERKLLARAQEAAEMGARLTSRLLLFARRRTLAREPINLNELVIGLAELLERTLGERITLTTSLEHELGTVIADPSEVENAVLNLAINARDAMPRGGRLLIETGHVDIRAEDSAGWPAQVSRTADSLSAKAAAPSVVPAPGRYVRLSVADTGVGMSPEVQARAFEPFFTTKESGRGTGLGLSSIYGLAQSSGGGVTLYSEAGKGTIVNVYLPRVEAARPVDQAVAPQLVENRARPGERVLLVEDNPDVRITAHSLLEALGYEVVEAHDGQAAIDRLAGAASDFTVVFSDVVMGGTISGFDLARWLQANRPEIGVLLASGYPGEVMRDLSVGQMASRAPELLRKPYSRHDLASALRRAIEAVELRPS